MSGNQKLVTSNQLHTHILRPFLFVIDCLVIFCVSFCFNMHACVGVFLFIKVGIARMCKDQVCKWLLLWLMSGNQKLGPRNQLHTYTRTSFKTPFIVIDRYNVVICCVFSYSNTHVMTVCRCVSFYKIWDC